MDGGDSEVRIPDEFYTALGNETRIRIIVELARARRVDQMGISYTELMERAGVEDSGKFNYHLSTLTDEFIRKADNRYYATLLGLRLYHLLISGYIDGPESEREFELAEVCPRCYHELEATINTWNTLVVSCSACSMRTIPSELPPRSQSSHGVAASLRVADLLSHHRMHLFSQGICPYCSGSATTNVHQQGSLYVDGFGGGLEFMYVFECQDCLWFDATTIGGGIYMHPVVVSFFQEHGRNIYQHRTWNHSFLCTDDHTTAARENPLEMEVSIPLDDDRLTVVVDEGCNVLHSSEEAA